ncbi:hypothetical protein ZTR_03869 [Talaromyces verruculosus]|nr:hypothetical protein ZTR_03869 [Talaromyces verruculosus]
MAPASTNEEPPKSTISSPSSSGGNSSSVLGPHIYTQTICVFGDFKFEVEFLVEDSIVRFETRYKLRDDLECDYLNPIELCNRLNTYIVPEAAVHAFLTFLFVINGYWLAIILNLPLLAYNGKKIFDNQHLLDATEIFRKLNIHKRESFVKLGFHLLMFFFYLYSMIVALIRDESH